MKGKKVIVLIVSEFVDGSCDRQTTPTFRSISSVLNVVVSSHQNFCAQRLEQNSFIKQLAFSLFRVFPRHMYDLKSISQV